MKVLLRGPREMTTEQWRVRSFWILAAILAIQFAVGAALVFYFWPQNRERSKDNAAAIAQIQAERRRNTLEACQTTNREHGIIVGFITASIPKDRRNDPQVIAYVRRAEAAFPQQDCRKVVEQRVQGEGQ